MYVSSSASIITFTKVNSRSIIDDAPISVRYYRDGRLYPNDGECTVFPSKDQRDWSKFERFWDKPKVEKFDPHTLQPFDKVLGFYDAKEEWECAFFSHFIEDNCYPVVCVGSMNYSRCIPYNDETKHLVGTSGDCPEYYKWWGK